MQEQTETSVPKIQKQTKNHRKFLTRGFCKHPANPRFSKCTAMIDEHIKTRTINNHFHI